MDIDLQHFNNLPRHILSYVYTIFAIYFTDHTIRVLPKPIYDDGQEVRRDLMRSHHHHPHKQTMIDLWKKNKNGAAQDGIPNIEGDIYNLSDYSREKPAWMAIIVSSIRLAIRSAHY